MSRPEHAIDLRWLMQLRWVAPLGQAALIAIVHFGLHIALPLAPLLAVVAIGVASNAAAAWWLKSPRPVSDNLVAGVLAVDVLLLTALLALSGGSLNPFNSLYLVYIALSAVVLDGKRTWGLTVLALGCFAALFFEPLAPAPAAGHHAHHGHHGGGGSMEMHLQGMWVAFGVASAFIVTFVQRIRRALEQRDAQLQASREKSAKSEKLASLATLAAGAAHELSTPLSTIAVVARELETALDKQDAREGDIADARLIREQVERCHGILRRMASEAGESLGEVPEPVGVRALVDAAIDETGRGERVIHESSFPEESCVSVPRHALVQSLRGLIDNACTASKEPVRVEVDESEGAVVIAVQDRGTGMADDVLSRAGEPFFTTKAPGKGMGLGLFLARTVVERLGGSLELTSKEGEGTTVTLTLPQALRCDDLPRDELGQLA